MLRYRDYLKGRDNAYSDYGIAALRLIHAETKREVTCSITTALLPKIHQYVSLGASVNIAFILFSLDYADGTILWIALFSVPDTVFFQ